jgi:hypothetical protein
MGLFRWLFCSGRICFAPYRSGGSNRTHMIIVWPKKINGKQCTVLWHIDDLKISHEDDTAVSEIIDAMNEHYGEVAPLVVSCRKVHDYLEMTLDFSAPGQCIIRMDDYVKSYLRSHLKI